MFRKLNTLARIRGKNSEERILNIINDLKDILDRSKKHYKIKNIIKVKELTELDLNCVDVILLVATANYARTERIHIQIKSSSKYLKSIDGIYSVIWQPDKTSRSLMKEIVSIIKSVFNK